jgi:hypothetical protein
MSASYSLGDEEKKSIEFDKHSADPFGGTQVSKFIYFLSLPPGL